MIVAAHNPGGYLRETLATVCAQEFTDWEAVVVDDGSAEDLAWVADVDPRITLRRQRNAGVAAARNAGAAATTAPLLTFLDQDDLWLPGYLGTQVRQLADERVDIASTGFDIIDEHGVYVGPGYSGFNSSYAELLRGDGLQCGTVAVRRTAFERAGGFRDYAISADWDLWLRMLRAGAGIARVDDVLGRWRQHGHNASRDYRGLWRDGRTILGQHAHPAARTGRRRLRRLAGVAGLRRARAPTRAVTSAGRCGWRPATRCVRSPVPRCDRPDVPASAARAHRSRPARTARRTSRRARPAAAARARATRAPAGRSPAPTGNAAAGAARSASGSGRRCGRSSTCRASTRRR